MADLAQILISYVVVTYYFLKFYFGLFNFMHGSKHTHSASRVLLEQAIPQIKTKAQNYKGPFRNGCPIALIMLLPAPLDHNTCPRFLQYNERNQTIYFFAKSREGRFTLIFQATLLTDLLIYRIASHL